jgi:hypothetical protein
VALIPLLGRLLLLPVMPFPAPQAHDEFSYLLAAKTFAAGRLTNPTPPLWVHFETFHVLMQPTYMSMYPPGQGVMLALGMLLFGHPWWAVWLSIGIMCAALTWMLYAWLPPRWALLGGVLAGLQFGFAHYWMNGYWGGSLAAIGGCLALGAWPRIKKSLRIRDSVLFAAGLMLAANTRPYEAAVLGLVLAGAILWWLIHDGRSVWPEFFRNAIVPMAAVIVPVLLMMGVYNKAVTGSPVAFAHQFYRHQMAVLQTFAFDKRRNHPHYNHEVIRDFYTNWEPWYEDAGEWGTWKGLIPGIKGRVEVVGACYFPLAVYLPIAWLSFGAMFFRRTRLLGIAFAAALAGNAMVNWLVPHYLAPFLGAMMAIHLQFLRWLRAWKWRGYAIGKPLFIAVLCFLGILFAVRYAQRLGPYPDDWSQARQRFLHQLEATPGKHLVYVRYRPHHITQYEWVYNEPDIPSAKVIWARAMTPAEDDELARYYNDRILWVLDADANPPVLTARSLPVGVIDPAQPARFLPLN